jgi:hypothetical protein
MRMIRARLVATQALPARVRLVRDDFIGALGIFLLVVVSTDPVALPFVCSRTSQRLSWCRAR